MVKRTAGGREIGGSSPLTLTKNRLMICIENLVIFQLLVAAGVRSAYLEGHSRSTLNDMGEVLGSLIDFSKGLLSEFLYNYGHSLM